MVANTRTTRSRNDLHFGLQVFFEKNVVRQTGKFQIDQGFRVQTSSSTLHSSTPFSFFVEISEDEALHPARGREDAVMRVKDKRAVAARRAGRTQEEREAAKEAAKRRRAAETRTEAEARRERERDRDRRRAEKKKAAKCAAAADVSRRTQPEPPAKPGTEGDDGSVIGPVTRQGARWSAPGDRSFGGVKAEVHSGIDVSSHPEWATAAWFAVKEYPAKEKRDLSVEPPNTVYAWACTHGKWTSWRKRRMEKGHLLVLKEVELVMRHRARKYAAVSGSTPVDLRTLVVRTYSGGPEAGEVVKTHRDHVIDENGDEDPRRVVSVVLVLEGGFRESGYDVRIHGEGGKFFFPHLETGDALALEGGPEGVVHDVGFYGDAARKGWTKRLSVVAFYAVGARKTRSARTSAASAG